MRSGACKDLVLFCFTLYINNNKGADSGAGDEDGRQMQKAKGRTEGHD
jgi:hypothetical protein